MVAKATELFAVRGFAAVSMEDIAAAAGIAKPLLYSYFGSKEGLFAACAERAGAELRVHLRKLVEGSDLTAEQRLWAGIEAVFAFVDRHRDAWALLYPSSGGSAGPVGEGAHQAQRAMEELLLSLFADTARQAGLGDDAAVHARPLARGFTAATIAMASDWVESAREPREVAALRLMNLAWMGFGQLLEGRMWLPDQGDLA